jgi:hypothetical protein
MEILREILNVLVALLSILLIHPGQELFFQGAVMLLMAVAVLVSFTCLILWYRSERKPAFVGYSVKALAFCVVLWITVAIIHHRNVYRDGTAEVIGRYQNADTGAYIDIRDDYTWVSDHNNLSCAQGTWEYYIGELGDAIYLHCKTHQMANPYLWVYYKEGPPVDSNPLNESVTFEREGVSPIRSISSDLTMLF